MAGRQAQPGKGSQELCSCEKRLLALSAGQDAPCNAERLQECSALHLRNLIHSLLTLIPHPAAGMGSLPQMGKPRHGAFCELELTKFKNLSSISVVATVSVVTSGFLPGPC